MSKPKQVLEINIPLDLLKELLTDSELKMVKQRVHIMQLLSRGLSVRAIAKKAQVGTDTVVRMARKLEESKTLRKTFEKLPPSSTASQWIFGQTDTKE
jgi:Trp operon repressor